MSTVSVYRRWPTEPLSERSEVLYCPPDAGADYGEDNEDGPTRHGSARAGNRPVTPGRSRQGGDQFADRLPPAGIERDLDPGVPPGGRAAQVAHQVHDPVQFVGLERQH